MDIYCPRCGEPWDNDSLHEEVAERESFGEPASYAQVAAEFRRHGCLALRAFGAVRCKQTGSELADIARITYEALGDDMDGAASILDDYAAR